MKTKAGPLAPVTYFTAWWFCNGCGSTFGTRVAQADMTARDREWRYDFKICCERCPSDRWLDQKAEKLFSP